MTAAKRPVVSILGYVSLYAGAVACGVFLWPRPLLLAGALLLIGVGALLAWKDRSAWAMYLAAFVLGPAAEYLAVKAGAWSYSEARWTLPIWLPFAWGLTAAIFLQVSRTVVSLGSDARRLRE